MAAATGSHPPARCAPLYAKLRPRRNASPEAVGADQRARLRGAMVEACAREGFSATTVNDLVSLAGVSKKTLYRHFDDKEACFLATYDVVVRDAIARITSAYRGSTPEGRDWAAGLCRAFDAFVIELGERPKASRLALVEVLAVGSCALERIERSEAVFVEMIDASLAQAPEPLPLPPPITRCLVGGIWFVARRHLQEGRPEDVSGCGRELLNWILSYRDPAVDALPRVARPPDWNGRVSSFDRLPDDPRSRMLSAAAEIAVRDGYGSLSFGGIFEAAAVLPEEFAAEFEDPGSCFLASLELLSAQALAIALRDSAGAPNWAAGVCRSIQSLLCQIATDPVLGRAAFVESRAAGVGGRERRSALIQGFAAVLVRRAPSERRTSPLIAEAIVGSAWSIAHRYVTAERAKLLPTLSAQVAYLALAPMIGAVEAVETIREELTLDSTAEHEIAALPPLGSSR